jgi:hypothetical protein
LDLVALENVEEHLACDPLGTVPLHGKIVGASHTKSKHPRVTVTYLADWQLDFEGVKDGSVPMYTIATVPVDQYGEFNIQLPDFGEDAAAETGEFEFHTDDDFLGPRDLATPTQNLEQNSAYPATVEFRAAKR